MTHYKQPDQSVNAKDGDWWEQTDAPMLIIEDEDSEEKRWQR